MAVKPIPEGSEHIIASLVVNNAAKAIEFYKQAFGAKEKGERAEVPDTKKVMHSELIIGPSRLYVMDDLPEFSDGKSRTPQALGGSPVVLHWYVEDCDAVIKRAEKAGAKVIMEPKDQFWGDRYGVIRDPFGHTWGIATHIKDLSPGEIKKGMKEMLAHAPGSRP